MRKYGHIILFLVIVYFTFVVNAQQSVTQQPNNPWLKTSFEKARKKPECTIELNKAQFLDYLTHALSLIEKGDQNGQPIKTTQFMVFVSIVKGWIQFKYFECDTEISKKWLVKIAKMFNQMYELNRAMDEAEAKGETAKFEENKKAFNQLVDLYIKEIQKPEKPSNAVMQKLETQKRQEQKAYKAYLKKTGQSEDDEEE